MQLNNPNEQYGLRQNSKGQCIIEEWAEFNNVYYSDTLKILRQRGILIKRFGKTLLLEKSLLDDILVLAIDEKANKLQLRITKQKNTVNLRKTYSNLVKNFISSGWSEETIKATLIAAVKEDQIRKLLESKNIKVPVRKKDLQDTGTIRETES